MQNLNRLIERNYKELKSKYAGRYQNDFIDKVSNDIEDKFHNSIVAILTHPDKFVYRSDKETLSYIKAYLFNDKRAQLKKLYLNKNVFIDIDTCIDLENANDYITE